MTKIKPPSAKVLKIAREKIGDYLRGIRKHRGLSQIDLSKRTGMSQADISEIETGSLNYGIDKLLAYSHGVDCYFFLGDRTWTPSTCGGRSTFTLPQRSLDMPP